MTASRAERLEAAARDLLNAVTFDDSGAGGRGGNGGLISRETIAKADKLRLILSEPAEPALASNEADDWTGCTHLDCLPACSHAEPYRCERHVRWLAACAEALKEIGDG